MYRTLAVPALALGLVLTPVLAGLAAPQNPPPLKPRVPKNDAVDVPYGGTVTEITKDSITIQWTATPGEQPKTFLLSETLVAGKIPMEPRSIPRGRRYSPMATSMYRITDVKVGDSVAIHYAHLNGVDICDHICIQKRPGSLVPPLPDEAENLMKDVLLNLAKSKFPPGKPIPPGFLNGLATENYIPYHEKMNAYWDLEDRGIPYPEKFGKKRRFPVAPMPREVKLGPAIAP